jgi:hypothetical protein
MQPSSKLPWRNSVAKRLLLQDLEDGTIPLDSAAMSAAVAYLRRTEYQMHDFGQFRDRLHDLRKRIRGKVTRSMQEMGALEHDLRIVSNRARNEHGTIRWEGTEAERLLRKDVEDGKDDTMPAQALWKSQDAYQVFTLDVFRGHIYQERRRQKFRGWLSHKNQ